MYRVAILQDARHFNHRLLHSLPSSRLLSSSSLTSSSRLTNSSSSSTPSSSSDPSLTSSHHHQPINITRRRSFASHHGPPSAASHQARSSNDSNNTSSPSSSSSSFFIDQTSTESTINKLESRARQLIAGNVDDGSNVDAGVAPSVQSLLPSSDSSSNIDGTLFASIPTTTTTTTPSVNPTQHLAQQWSLVNSSYHTLLLDAMSGQLALSELLRIIRSWFVSVPKTSFPLEGRTEVVNEILREYFIKYLVPFGSLVGQPPRATPSGPRLSSGITPMRLTHAAKKLEEQPEDLWRDIILKEEIPLDQRTIKLLVIHAALMKVPDDTAKLVAFLKAYRKQQSEEILTASMTSIDTSILSSTLSFDIVLFNELLDIFAHHSDPDGPIVFFTELGNPSSEISSSSSSSLSDSSLLFGRLRPNHSTYEALIRCFAKVNQVDSALSMIHHMLHKRGDGATVKSSPTLSSELMSLLEHLIERLVENGYVHSGIRVLNILEPQIDEVATQALREEMIRTGQVTNPDEILPISHSQFGFERPSMKCFLPILLEIPRCREELVNDDGSNPFLTMSISNRFQLLNEIYGKFRYYGFHMTNDKDVVTLIQRVVLMGTGSEIRGRENDSSESSSSSSSTTSIVGGGFTQHNWNLFQVFPPPTLSPFRSHPTGPTDFALQILQYRLLPFLEFGASSPTTPLPESIEGVSRPTIQLLNDVLYLFGVLQGNINLLTQLVPIFQERLMLQPDIHTINLLMETYGRGKMLENVVYMYQQAKASTFNASQAGAGGVRANVQTINCALNYMIGTSNTPSGDGSSGSDVNPFQSLQDLLSDMLNFQIAPNHETWLLVLRKLTECSGNAEEAAYTSFGGVAGGIGDDTTQDVPFARPVAPGVVWNHVKQLLACANAAASVSPSSSSVVGVSSLTGDILQQYLLLSAKLHDHTSVMYLLESMAINAGVDTSALQLSSSASPSSSDPTELSQVSQFLPSQFCKEYFTSRLALKQHLHYRLHTQDWNGCVKLLKLFTIVSDMVREGPSSSPIGVEHFGWLRHLYDVKQLNQLVRELVQVLSATTTTTTPSSTPTGVTYCEARISLSTHLFQALLSHGRIETAVDMLDQIAANASTVEQSQQQASPMFPQKALPLLLSTVRNSSDPTFDFDWTHGIIRRCIGQQSWSRHVPVSEVMEQLRNLLPPKVRTDSTNIDIYTQLWRLGVQALGSSEALTSETIHPILYELSERLVQSLLPRTIDLSNHTSSFGRSRSNFGADAYLPTEITKRVGILLELIHTHERSVLNSNNKVDLMIQPLLETSTIESALEYCIRINSSEGVSSLFRYVHGRSTNLYESAQYFNKMGELLKTNMTTTATTTPLLASSSSTTTPSSTTTVSHQPSRSLSMDTYESLFRYWRGDALSEESYSQITFSRELHPTKQVRMSSSSSNGSSNSEKVDIIKPNPLLAWEGFQQMKREKRPIKVEIMRTLIRLQGTYGSNDLPMIGRNQLMVLWKESHDGLPWFESLSLVPSVLTTLREIQLNYNLRIDSDTKDQLVTMLYEWVSRSSMTPLPKLFFHTTKENGVIETVSLSKSKKDGTSGSSAISRQVMQAQRREQDKLITLRRNVDEAFRQTRQHIDKIRNGQVVSNDDKDLIDLTTRSYPIAPIGSSSLPNPSTIRVREKLRRSWRNLANTLPWPLSSEAAVYMQAVQAVLRAPPRELIEMVHEMSATSTDQTTIKENERPEEVFRRVIAFIYRHRSSVMFTQLFLGVSAYPSGLSACFGGGITRSGDDGAASSSNVLVDDVPTRVLRSLLPRSNDLSSRWNIPEPSAIRGAKIPARDLATNTTRLVDAQQLLSTYAPAWWANQLLYWHFRTSDLTTVAFHPDLLFTVPPRGQLSPPLATAPAPSTSATTRFPPHNAYSITPRMIHTWVMKSQEGGIPSADRLIDQAYAQTFRFMIHEARGLARIEAYASRIAALAKEDGGSKQPPAQPSPIREAIDEFTFHLFKKRYVSYRSSCFADGVTKRELRSRKNFDAVAASFRSVTPAESTLADAIKKHQSQTYATNTVYTLFHSFALIDDINMLSAKVYNIVLSSLVQFDKTGLDVWTFQATKTILQHMSLLGYPIAPVVSTYLLEACSEQISYELYLAGSNAEAALERTKPYVTFAYQLLDVHALANGDSKLTRTVTSDMVKPILPDPQYGNEPVKTEELVLQVLRNAQTKPNNKNAPTKQQQSRPAQQQSLSA